MNDICEGCGNPATFLVASATASTYSCDNDLAGSVRYVTYGDTDAPHAATQEIVTIQPLAPN